MLTAQALNSPGADKIEKFGSTFAPKDKVMQIRSDCDKEVYNGDIGFVTRIDAEEGQVFVTFDGPRLPMTAANLIAWCWRTRRQFTRRKAQNIRL